MAHGWVRSASGRGLGCALGVRLAKAAQVTKRFGTDVRGIAAVEFAFIAPILLVMLVGAVEITRAVSIDRRLSVVTNMIADLVARETKLTGDDVEAIYDIAEQVMAPFDASDLKLSIIPVMSAADNASNTLVYPSTANRPSYNGGDLPAKCQAYALTAGILQKNESVIVVESSYAFKPLFLGYVMNAADWTEKAFAKPRKALCVAFDGDTCTSSCFSS
jgi:Flp pilus assembly protein TadG